MNKIFLALVLVLPHFANAQAPRPARSTAQVAPKEAAPAPAKGGAKASVQISFDDELVQGRVPKPEVDYISTRKQFNFKKMIKLRENFVPEVQKGKSEYGIAE